MKKWVIVLAAVMLSACGTDDMNETETDTTIISTESIAVETTETETIIETTAETTTETAIETTVETTTELPEPYDWSGFVLSEHCGEFDEAEPLKYHTWEYTDVPEIEPSRLDSAYQAVIESDYYKEVTALGNERLEWNGSDFVWSEESYYFLLESYSRYIDYEAAPELVLKPEFINCIQLPFDGVNTEEIMIFGFPLAESEIEWSGTSKMYIAVYVNADGEARVIYEVSDQTLSTQINPIEYSDGMIHLEFGSGHTSGTSSSTILSFSNGEYKVEYEGIAVRCDEDGFVMRDDISAFFEHNILLFRDGLRNCYCELKRVPLSDEISRAILADESVNAESGDHVYAVGGKYILTYKGVFVIEDGMLVPYENGEIVPSFEEEGVPALNVNIDSEEWSNDRE